MTLISRKLPSGKLVVEIPCGRCEAYLAIDPDATHSTSTCGECGALWDVNRRVEIDEVNASSDSNTVEGSAEEAIVTYTIEENRASGPKDSFLRLLTIIVFLLLFSLVFAVGLFFTAQFRPTFLGTPAFSAIFSIFLLVLVVPCAGYSAILGRRIAKSLFETSAPLSRTYTFSIPSRYDLDNIIAPFCEAECSQKLEAVEKQCLELREQAQEQQAHSPEDVKAAGVESAVDDIMNTLTRIRNQTSYKH